MQIWNRLLIVIIILCVNFISFCACSCILFVLILFIFCVKNYDSFMLIFFHLVFSNNIFNFTDILFYYVLANRQFRYPTSLHSVTRGAGTAYISGAPEFTVGFKMCSRYSIFSFMCMFCRSLFVLLPCFVLAILLSVLRFTDSDYPDGISKLVLQLSPRSLINQYLLKLLGVHVTSLVLLTFLADFTFFYLASLVLFCIYELLFVVFPLVSWMFVFHWVCFVYFYLASCFLSRCTVSSSIF
jgi:hypothetical protein